MLGDCAGGYALDWLYIHISIYSTLHWSIAHAHLKLMDAGGSSRRPLVQFAFEQQLIILVSLAKRVKG